ncbi:hypothetical protein AVEN_48435-1 [Araneus ventricosus]|uniref:Uncharacterized protein n=1 Tax=Araneus ventricosus TaxID=182803 RepID=A0A4Y2R9D5_ARAVE|nr:hypothetical protein AVEN_48435-1 [Araneus ventricosus]
MFGSRVPIVPSSKQKKGESQMEQDWSCRPDDPISPIPGDECVLLCPMLCGGLALWSKNKTPKLKNPGRALQPH